MKAVVELYKGADLVTSIILKSKPGKEVFFKIEAKGNQYAFYYAEKKNTWILLLDNADAKYLSTKSAGGFVLPMANHRTT